MTPSAIRVSSSDFQQYCFITGNYWAFTLTDGALRMLVVLHFHQLGYPPLSIALLFLFYEIFGVITNVVGGYLGSRIGLNRTMNLGLIIQVAALLMLAAPPALLTVPWVMGAQALSGIAKDLNKMSAKSSIKMLVGSDQPGRLFKWVALLTGSKNALKGLGFFVGGLLLTLVGFTYSVIIMAVALGVMWFISLLLLKKDLGKTKRKPKFKEIFAKSRAINILSAARLFLFGARDIWFVVALPVYLTDQLGWDFWWVGGFIACWIMGYGAVQSMAPGIIRLTSTTSISATIPSPNKAFSWAILLTITTIFIALALQTSVQATPTLIIGLMLFGGIFAVNSSLHSYLIIYFAKEDGVSLDVGFYYMANALGRLIGTIVSGWLYQSSGLVACLWGSAVFLGLAALLAGALPNTLRSFAK